MHKAARIRAELRRSSRGEDPGATPILGHAKAACGVARPIGQPKGLAEDQAGDARLVRPVSGKEGDVLDESVI